MCIRDRTKVGGIEEAGEALSVKVTDDRGEESVIEAEKVLMCVGRRPATEGLGLEMCIRDRPCRPDMFNEKSRKRRI